MRICENKTGVINNEDLWEQNRSIYNTIFTHNGNQNQVKLEHQMQYFSCKQPVYSRTNYSFQDMLGKRVIAFVVKLV